MIPTDGSASPATTRRLTASGARGGSPIALGSAHAFGGLLSDTQARDSCGALLQFQRAMDPIDAALGKDFPAHLALARCLGAHRKTSQQSAVLGHRLDRIGQRGGIA